MSTNATVAALPCYVLMDGDGRLGPKVVPSDAGIDCSAIYGFSGKGRYDTFCANSQRALIPYPLVKGYLRNQVAAPGDALQLVVLDATGPRQLCLHAATMEAVLNTETSQVTAAYRLNFDPEANAYSAAEASV